MKTIKSENGVAYILWIFIVIVAIAAVGFVSYYLLNKVNKVETETIKTDMLVVQGKIKLIYDDYKMSKNESSLKGIKIKDNQENELVKKVMDRKLLDGSEENFDLFYILSKHDLDEMGLSDKVGENQFLIVNYATKEIILDVPYKDENDKNGKEYYRFSEIEKLQ